MRKTFAPIALALMFAAPAFAATGGADQMGDPATAPGPGVVSANPNVYVVASGGIGDEDRTKLEAQAGHYSMRMVFSEDNGQYVVADSVVLKRRGAEVMNVSDVGPLVYAQVPPGQYALTASYKGVTQTKNVTIGAKAGDVHFVWPVALD
ncbi:MAG TPA: hypothetical protein VGN52_03185 [Burkholderiales bacterium]|jgi:hypothetical protein